MRFFVSILGLFKSVFHISMVVGVIFLFLSCGEDRSKTTNPTTQQKVVSPDEVALVVLGTAQDAGSPQIGCAKMCCATIGETRYVVALGVVDSISQKTYLFEATPDIGAQIDFLNQVSGNDKSAMPDAIFLTHAHIGHYTGLMYLGKEAVNAQKVPVHAMPKMASFLKENGPWGQLVKNKNIHLNT
ncbi:MAG: MBL fold metallo-hydrolase, partial [Flavobacteriaceae bacterium]